MPVGFAGLGQTSLCYRIEPDGSVLIAGRRARTLIHADLHDGSAVHGGIDNSGAVFGERLVPIGSVVRKFPLRWCEDPNPERAPEPLPGTTWSATTPIASAITPTPVVPVLDLRPKYRAKYVQPYRPAAYYPPTDFTVPFMPVKAQELMRHPRGSSSSSENLDALRQAERALEEARAGVARANADRRRLSNDIARLQAENSQLQSRATRAEAISKEIRDQLEAVNIELDRKVDRRRLQLSSVPKTELQVPVQAASSNAWRDPRVPTTKSEEFSSTVLEVDDPSGEIRYVIVAQAPKDTTESVLQKWLTELYNKVAGQVGANRTALTLVPTNFGVQVFELIPGVDTLDAVAQF